MAIITLSIFEIETNVTGTDKKPKKKDTADLVIGDQTNVSSTVDFDVEWEKVQLMQPEKKGEKPTYKTTKGKGVLTFSLILQRINFSKQMYSPNSIKALIQIDAGKNAVQDLSAELDGMHVRHGALAVTGERRAAISHDNYVFCFHWNQSFQI